MEAIHELRALAHVVDMHQLTKDPPMLLAGITMLGAFMSWWGLILGLGMGVVAYVEFNGAARLRKLDPTAAKMLALNQLFLGALLLSYAVYSLWMARYGAGPFAETIAQNPELKSMLPGFEDLARLIYYLMYGTLAAVAIFVQGGNALYYLSRRKYIEAYIQQTPQWIRDAQRAGMPM
jgi:hypothetical protein